MDRERALRRLVGKARAYVLVTRDLDAHLWEIEEAERQLDQAAVRCLSEGASRQEVHRVTGMVAALMEQADVQAANAAA